MVHDRCVISPTKANMCKKMFNFAIRFVLLVVFHSRHLKPMKMIKNTLKICMIVLFSMTLALPVYGQKKESVSKERFASPLNLPLQKLHEIVYSSFGEVESMLKGYGYQPTTSRDTLFDTIDYIPLTYLRSIFVSGSESPSWVAVMTSVDGLCNYFRYCKTPKDGFTPLQELVDLHYTFNKERSSFQGSVPSKNNDTIYRFEMLHSEDDTSITVTCKNIGELLLFLEAKKMVINARMDSTITQALALSSNNRYAEALAVMDSVRGIYPPKDEELSKSYERIEGERIHHYLSLRNTAIADGDYRKAVEYCDTILSFNPANAEEIAGTREVLLTQISGSAVRYRQVRPEAFDSVRMQVQHLVNEEIRNHANLDHYLDIQRLDIFLNIHTNSINESHASFDLTDSYTRRKMVKQFQERKEYLGRCADQIAHHPLIEPVIRDNIFIITDDTIKASIRWQFSTKVIDSDHRLDSAKLMDIFIDTIEKHYFYIQKLSKTEINEDGSPKTISVPRLPTKRVYVFGQTVKRMDDMRYVDIELIEFQTALGGSWVPSLFIPGLGTYKQGARSDVVSRALPFFFFGALGAAGLIMEGQFAKQGVERAESWDDLSGQSILYLKNFGYWVGVPCLVVSGTIYLTDLVGAIRNSIVNTQRSKVLRKELKEHSIIMQSQDVIIQ